MVAVYICNAPNTTRTAAEKNLMVSHVKRLLRRHPYLTAAGKAVIQVKIARNEKREAKFADPQVSI